MSKYLFLVLSLLFFPVDLSAQRLDPDWCWTCSDVGEHFLAGAGIDIATRLVAKRTWQRVAITCTVGAAYEFGQEAIVRSAGLHGRGYGFGPKDLIVDCAGALAAEGLIALLKRV